jgi:hypothetical protein
MPVKLDIRYKSWDVVSCQYRLGYILSFIVVFRIACNLSCSVQYVGREDKLLCRYSKMVPCEFKHDAFSHS